MLLALPLLHAQDTRQVVEPKFPPACEVLTARLTAPGGALSDADERRPDTARLQKARTRVHLTVKQPILAAAGFSRRLRGPKTRSWPEKAA